MLPFVENLLMWKSVRVCMVWGFESVAFGGNGEPRAQNYHLFLFMLYVWSVLFLFQKNFSNMTSVMIVGGAVGGGAFGGGGGGNGDGDDWRRGNRRPSHYLNDVSTLWFLDFQKI